MPESDNTTNPTNLEKCKRLKIIHIISLIIIFISSLVIIIHFFNTDFINKYSNKMNSAYSILLLITCFFGFISIKAYEKMIQNNCT